MLLTGTHSPHLHSDQNKHQEVWISPGGEPQAGAARAEAGQGFLCSHLPRSQGHLGVGRLAELGQLCQDIDQLVCQGGVTATELVLATERAGNA